ncbi:MAG: M20/M25/M40 family metallo-hydrolase [Clostridia bacterium]|nr:M20/M25/M40 family metallo-hydrolase [Clostridia bacterium]
MPELLEPGAAPDLARAVEAEWGRALADLVRLVRQPSVAAQGLGVEACAELTAELFRASGADAVEVWRLPGASPVVYAEFAGEGERTLLFYNHYDVQPPEPLELWSSPPWEAEIREGRIVGRGVSDDKAPLVARIAALRVLGSLGPLPCRVKFLVEGEEEIGSVHFHDYVRAHRERLAADACIWEFGGVDQDGHPELTLGLKGLAYVELSAQGANRDQHSSVGAIVPNPAWRLVWALAALKGPDGRVRIPGFYDDVKPPTQEELRAVYAVPWNPERMRKNLGIEAFTVADDDEARLALLFQPTCTICGFESGYRGPGPKTVLPATARAKVDMRLVPDQDPEDVFRKLRRFLDESGFADVQAELLSGERAYRTPPSHPFVKLVARTAEAAYGRSARIHVTSAGSGPMYPVGHELGVPMVSTGCGYFDSRAHAPDENIRLADFAQGIYHMAMLVREFGRADA